MPFTVKASDVETTMVQMLRTEFSAYYHRILITWSDMRVMPIKAGFHDLTCQFVGRKQLNGEVLALIFIINCSYTGHIYN